MQQSIDVSMQETIDRMLEMHHHAMALRDLIQAATLSDVSLDIDNLRHLLGRTISDADDLAGTLIPEDGS
jgi:hypothetical protein